MVKSRRRLTGLTGLTMVIGLVAGGWWMIDGRADQKQPDEEKRLLAKFMRQKLEASNLILEGLCVEDFELIEQGATRLETISSAEKWRISNDALYRQQSAEFQRIAAGLKKQATEKKLDAAALAWVRATMSCIECHRFVRGMMIAEGKPPAELDAADRQLSDLLRERVKDRPADK